MLDPYINAETKFQKELAGASKSLSLASIDNITDLLFDIARSLACYIRVNYTSGENINVEFVSRQALVETDYSYIIGAEEADFDTSSIMVSSKNEYYSVANNYASDGFDTIWITKETAPSPSSKYLNEHEQRQYEKERRDTNYDRLLFSLSPTMLDNIHASGGGWQILNEPINLQNGIFEDLLHTSLYVLLVSPEDSSGSIVCRPACGLMTKIGNENKHYSKLSDYVNEVMARDKQYYETEYNLTVPFWNGFSKQTDGTNPSWKNIKLGSKIKLSEEIKRYISGSWVNQRVTRDYVVVGIERNLQKPETKLKLHNLERFAFGYWDGALDTLPSETYEIPEHNKFIAGTVKGYLIDETSEPIQAGDAVMITGSRTVAKAKSHSNYYGKTIGIALQAGEAYDDIEVQIDGKVYSENYNFTNIGNFVFLRTNSSGLNISETILSEKTADEDMLVRLGTIDSEKSFIIEKKEWCIL